MGYHELIHQRVAAHIRAQRIAEGTDPMEKRRVIISVQEGKDSAHITYFNAGTKGVNEFDISRADLDASLEPQHQQQSVVYMAPAPAPAGSNVSAGQSVAA